MKVLISPLGLAPGVVTGAYYALIDAGYGQVDKIVTISTRSNLVQLCEREIARELEQLEDGTGILVEYERLAIGSDEVRTSADVSAFTDLLEDLLRSHLAAGDEIYLNLTGGRKSMVAAAAMAAQLHRPAKEQILVTFHLHVDEEINREGQITSLLKKPATRRRRYLKPPAEELTLVEIPLLPVQLGERRDDLQAALFEIRVGQFITRRWNYPRVRYNFYPPLLRSENIGEVDVYADDTTGQTRRVLVCECKLRVRDDPDGKPLTRSEVRQLERKARALNDYRQKQASNEGYTIRFESWLVTNATEAESEAWQAAKGAKVELVTATLPRNWRDRADWKVGNIQPMKKPASGHKTRL